MTKRDIGNALTETSRDSNIKIIRALTALRKDGLRHFFIFAVEELTEQQTYILLQKIGEWISENPKEKT
jgi:hypothetical protein